ncbi:hypothetical protein [Actinokineospora globicatena]|uniref:Uncharacterized protein n=1 Tax=Actinokineospora globicatena TaxID=103729 RepID=A0A9W6QMN2_9PSEU|nr:hypothetical protein [Actinokineospora globicatena]GLW91299.1 hypothetical protein Aglo03_21150 [Actinokineospora globicatena]
MHPLTTDLRALRRGRAVHTTPLPPRLGPALRALCAVTDADDDVSARTKVIARLTELADQLPDDLRLCFTAAFALTERTRQPFYSDRLVWAGTELRRESRTIRRRVDESITTVIQLARARQSWHTEQLHAVVSLAGAPEVLESRRVVADTDLTEITLGWSTSGVEDFAITVVHGGTLVDLARKSRNRVAATVRLPTPLRAGQPHSIAVRLRPNPMHPLYVCTPHTPCATFTLRVIFPPTATPTHALLLDGVPPLEVEDDIAPHLPLSIDATGHLTTTFTNLTPHLSYGIRW